MSTPNPLGKVKTFLSGTNSVFNFNLAPQPDNTILDNPTIPSSNNKAIHNPEVVKQAKEFIAIPSLRKARESSYFEDIYSQFKDALEKNDFEKAEIETLLKTLKDNFKKIHSRYPTLEQVKVYLFPDLNKLLPPEWQSEQGCANAMEIAKKAQEILNKINSIFDIDHHPYFGRLNRAKEKYVLEVIANLDVNHPIREKLLAIEAIAFPETQLTFYRTKETLISELGKIAKEHYVLKAKKIFDGLIANAKAAETTLEPTLVLSPHSMIIQYQSSPPKLAASDNQILPNNRATHSLSR